MSNRLRHQALYLPVLALLTGMLFSSLARIGLAAIAWSNLDHSVGGLLSVFLNGFIGDFLFCLALAGFLLFFTSLTHSNHSTAFAFKAKRALAVLALSAFLLFVFISEFIFWEEFGARFNFVAVDYLIYTSEVMAIFVNPIPCRWFSAGYFWVLQCLPHLYFAIGNWLQEKVSALCLVLPWRLSVLPYFISQAHGLWTLQTASIVKINTTRKSPTMAPPVFFWRRAKTSSTSNATTARCRIKRIRRLHQPGRTRNEANQTPCH